MHTVKVSSLKYEESKTLHAEDYFKNIIGVTLPANSSVKTIELEFSALRAPYVTTKPLHHSQKIITQKEDGKIVLHLHVIPNRELESVILSYGCDVKVLQPQSLKINLKEIAEAMGRCYEQ